MKIIIGGKEFDVSDEQVTKSIEDKSPLSLEGEYVVREAAEEQTFVSNLKSTHEKAGAEIAIKEARKKLGLEFEGKTVDNLLDAHKKKVLEEAQIEPAKQVEALNKDINTLKTTLATVTSEKEAIESRFKGFKSEHKINSEILSSLPENILLPKDDMATLLKTKIKISVDENERTVVLDENGDIVKNKTTLDPIPVKEAISNFFSTNTSYLKGASGGAGGDDSGNDSKITLSKFSEDMKSKGIGVNSEEYNTELNKLVKSEQINLDA